jgi:hypothetical protein
MLADFLDPHSLFTPLLAVGPWPVNRRPDGTAFAVIRTIPMSAHIDRGFAKCLPKIF